MTFIWIVSLCYILVREYLHEAYVIICQFATMFLLMLLLSYMEFMITISVVEI